MADKKKQITISVDSLQGVYDEAMQVREELETATANQQKLRKDAIETLKADPELKTVAEQAINTITELIAGLDERALPLLEDLLKEQTKNVSETADNFVMTQVKEEATAVKDKIAGLRETWDKLNKQYDALVTVMDQMGLEHTEVPEIQKLSRGGGRPAGSGGSRSSKTRDFSFVYTKDGQEYPNWDTISRALFYSSKDSGGSASEGRLSTEEFKTLFKDTFGHTDDMKESWTITLPNGKVLGFVRKAAVEQANAETATPAETGSPEGSTE